MSASRDDDRPPGDAGFAPAVGQMLFMPLTVMMYGLNLLARTARGGTATGGEPAPPVPAPPRDPVPVAPPAAWTSLQPGWRRPDLELVHPERNQRTSPPAPLSPDGGEPRGIEEHTRMNDNKNLQDDMLKTVRYWISFEKRDYEAVLDDGIDHVYDNLTDAQFTAWKMAEFMQNLKRKKIKVPFAWQGRHKRVFYTADACGDHVIDFDHKDKKYLTVDWEVVGRVVRRKARFDERKTEALEDIADRLKDCCGKHKKYSGRGYEDCEDRHESDCCRDKDDDKDCCNDKDDDKHCCDDGKHEKDCADTHDKHCHKLHGQIDAE